MADDRKFLEITSIHVIGAEKQRAITQKCCEAGHTGQSVWVLDGVLVILQKMDISSG
jgi:hypothetical protein